MLMPRLPRLELPGDPPERNGLLGLAADRMALAPPPIDPAQNAHHRDDQEDAADDLMPYRLFQHPTPPVLFATRIRMR